MKRLSIVIVLLLTAGMSATAFGDSWPKEQGVYTAITFEKVPAFPVKLAGYRALDGEDFFGEDVQLSGVMTVDDGAGWQMIDEFPSSSIDCIAGAYMVRWQVSDPYVTVQSAIDNPRDTPPPPIKTGSFGYMYGSSCTEPRFKFAASKGKTKAESVDIKYELKFWKTAG